jgi:precorrin-4 methylase
LSKLKCLWCENPNLTLKQASILEPENQELKESIDYIKENIINGHSNRRIIQDFKFIYGRVSEQIFSHLKEVIVPNYLLLGTTMYISSIAFLLKYKSIKRYILSNNFKNLFKKFKF